jgi:hypothetical protein
MSRVVDRATLSAEHALLKDLAARFRRRHHYMCRNRDNEYSVRDLTLALFAADTADQLAQHTETLLKRLDDKDRADKRYKMRYETSELSEERARVLSQVPHRPLEIIFMEEDSRALLIDIESREWQEILSKQEGYNSEDDREAEVRATLQVSWRHQFSHVRYWENAVREDIMREENGDFENLLGSFR